MSAVCDECKCPRCGNLHAYTEFQTRTGCTWITCDRCGFWYEESFDFTTRTMTVEQTGGFGSFAISARPGVTRVGFYGHQQPLHRKLARMRARARHPKVISASFTHKVRGRWQTFTVKKPKPRLDLPRRASPFTASDTFDIPF